MHNLRLIALIFVSTFSSVMLFAQKEMKVETEFTYHAPLNLSIIEAKNHALEQAKLAIIEEKFGSIVSRTTSTKINNSRGRSNVDIKTLGSSEVRGEWLRTIGEPEYSEPLITDEFIVITVKVKGIIREIKNAETNLDIKVLRNGFDNKFEDTNFRNYDDIYLSFTSPIDGYIAVYLIGENDEAFCLLPYPKQTNGKVPVAAGQAYTFFSPQHAPAEEKGYVEQYVMTCEKSLEKNQLYVLFSPNPFTKAIDKNTMETILPRSLSYQDFQKWLAKCRSKDKDFCIRIFDLTITK